MGNSFGNNYRVTIFGESHSKAIGIVIDGLPPGSIIDFSKVKNELLRRSAASNQIFSTLRIENDSIRILSGYADEHSTGTPLSIIIDNVNFNSDLNETQKNYLRPSHADYSILAKYGENRDYRGSGHSSARLTAAITVAGSIAKQVLYDNEGITIGSHILSIGAVRDTPLDRCDIPVELLENLKSEHIPLINKDLLKDVEKELKDAAEKRDSIGGIIECAVLNLKAGIGSPFFDSLESSIAHMLFSIPAVKGVDFGAGFQIARMRGSSANDPFYLSGGRIKTLTNNSGGINGGISNGMPIVLRAAFRPAPTIGIEQKTVDFAKMENILYRFDGLHDVCFLPRAVPIVECAVAICILDQFLG